MVKRLKNQVVLFLYFTIHVDDDDEIIFLFHLKLVHLTHKDIIIMIVSNYVSTKSDFLKTLQACITTCTNMHSLCMANSKED